MNLTNLSQPQQGGADRPAPSATAFTERLPHSLSPALSGVRSGATTPRGHGRG